MIKKKKKKIVRFGNNKRLRLRSVCIDLVLLRLSLRDLIFLRDFVNSFLFVFGIFRGILLVFVKFFFSFLRCFKY